MRGRPSQSCCLCIAALGFSQDSRLGSRRASGSDPCPTPVWGWTQSFHPPSPCPSPWAWGTWLLSSFGQAWCGSHQGPPCALVAGRHLWRNVKILFYVYQIRRENNFSNANAIGLIWRNSVELDMFAPASLKVFRVLFRESVHMLTLSSHFRAFCA